MTLLALPRRSYRPGDRGERNPITPAQIALAVEYRSLGLSWACCGTLLRLSHNRLRVAVCTAPPLAADGRRGRE